MNDSFLSLLGLCRKSGKLSLGHDACKVSANNGRASAIFIASDASQRLVEEISGLSERNNIKTYFIKYTMLEIKTAIGVKSAVMSVDDSGFAKSLIEKLNNNGRNEAYDK